MLSSYVNILASEAFILTIPIFCNWFFCNEVRLSLSCEVAADRDPRPSELAREEHLRLQNRVGSKKITGTWARPVVRLGQLGMLTQYTGPTFQCNNAWNTSR